MKLTVQYHGSDEQIISINEYTEAGMIYRLVSDSRNRTTSFVYEIGPRSMLEQMPANWIVV